MSTGFPESIHLIELFQTNFLCISIRILGSHDLTSTKKKLKIHSKL